MNNNLYYIKCKVKRSEDVKSEKKKLYITNQEINIDYFINKIKDKYINTYDKFTFKPEYITILSIELIAGRETEKDFIL